MELPPNGTYGSSASSVIEPSSDWEIPLLQMSSNYSNPNNTYMSYFDKESLQWEEPSTRYPMGSGPSSGGTGQDDHSAIRHTPSSLGWTPDAQFLNLYQFVFGRGKEQYFQLQPPHIVTDKTPSRVYLDIARNPQKMQYLCLYPGICSKLFSRIADLERHYKIVHAPADQKVAFPCDYSRCARLSDPFTRKDHYRDHLRGYHKEDIGSVKIYGMKVGGEQEATWLVERRIDSKYWRCAICLVRIYVADDAWECPNCKRPCEAERVAARQRLNKLAEKDNEL